MPVLPPLSQAQAALNEASCNLYTFDFPLGLLALKSLPRSFQFHAVREEWPTYRPRLSDHVKERFEKDAPAVLDATSELLTFFTSLTEDPAPFVSLRSIDADYINANNGGVSACWHRDAAALTLQLTLQGTGMHWTADSNVRRAYFQRCQIQKREDPDGLALLVPEDFAVVPAGVVALLKGEMQPREADLATFDFWSNFIDITQVPTFNVGQGLIHRGPGSSHEGRLVLTVSTFRVPAFLV